MKFVPLSKTEAKAAELETTPCSNLIWITKNKSKKEQKALMEASCHMHDWLYDLDAKKFRMRFRKGLGTTVKKNKAHITKILGKPLYHVNYEYREAVWGFQVDKVKVICYYSFKGWAIQVSQNCSVKKATELINEITRLLSQ